MDEPTAPLSPTTQLARGDGAAVEPSTDGQRHCVTEALRESEALFRTIVNQAAAAVAHTDLDGKLTLVKARFARITDHAPEALVGTSIFALIHPEDLGDNISSRTPPSSPPDEGEIRVVSSNVESRIVQVVADIGIGIASEALPAIFDAFAQERPW